MNDNDASIYWHFLSQWLPFVKNELGIKNYHQYLKIVFNPAVITFNTTSEHCDLAEKIVLSHMFHRQIVFEYFKYPAH